MKNLSFSFLLLCLIFSCSEHRQNENSENSKSDKNLTVLEVTQTFVESLGQQNFQKAFDLQKVKSWGDFEHFSSEKAFGGITSVKIHKIEQKPDKKGQAVVYVNAFYAAKGGDNTFKENFYLKKFSGSWKIVRLKVLKTVKQKIPKETVKKEIKKFLLPNKEIVDFATGDINNDNIEDVAFLQSASDDQKELLYVLLRNKKKKLTMFKIVSVFDGSPGQGMSFSIEKGKLKIFLYIGGHTGGLNHDYTFNYVKQDNDLYLTKFSSTTWSGGMPNEDGDYEEVTDETTIQTAKDFGKIRFEDVNMDIASETLTSF